MNNNDDQGVMALVRRNVRAVIEERTHQRAKWGDEHDDLEHHDGSLAHVAALLAASTVHGDTASIVNGNGDDCATSGDHWAPDLMRKHYAPRDRLRIAAALLIAELDRIDRREVRLAADGRTT